MSVTYRIGQANWAQLTYAQETDSKSLWNYTLSPGWSGTEISILRSALMVLGVGQPNTISQRYLPHKTAAQINLQTQKMFGQQSLAEFTSLHIDPYRIFEINAAKKDVRRKCGCIVINTGKSLTRAETLAKIAENKIKYGLTQAEIDAIKIERYTGVVQTSEAPTSSTSTPSPPTTAETSVAAPVSSSSPFPFPFPFPSTSTFAREQKLSQLSSLYTQLNAIDERLREMDVKSADTTDSCCYVNAATSKRELDQKENKNDAINPKRIKPS